MLPKTALHTESIVQMAESQRLSLYIFFFIIAAVEIAQSLILLIRDLKREDEQSKVFSKGMVASICTLVAYCLSLYAREYLWISLFSSIYFISIDLMLSFMAIFFRLYTGYENSKTLRVLEKIARVYVLFDAICLLINPFYEFVISYVPSKTWAYHYYFQPHFLYRVHLVYSYLCIAAIIAMLVWKLVAVPRIYSFKYHACILAILLDVLLNAIFVFIPSMEWLDYSALLYAPTFWLIVLSWKFYAKRKMRDVVRDVIVDEMEQALVLFDDEGHFVMSNHSAEFLNLQENCTFDGFVEKYGFREYYQFGAYESFDGLKGQVGEETHFQYRFQEVPDAIFRCDYRALYDEKERRICSYFIFTNTSLNVDLLTGFYTNMQYLYEHEANGDLEYPIAVAVCDLNRLSSINERYGRDAGDTAILTVARKLKTILPEETEFYRLEDANLMVICQNADLASMRKHMQTIRKEVYKELDAGGEHLDVQVAISFSESGVEKITDLVQTALKSMRTKKLMDHHSGHSSMLDSMEEMLREGDSTTAEHVARTQRLGKMLGERLGLSDEEISNLRLLCLLHDIGKVGIPVEILNKPYELEDYEWEAIKEHVEKGYRIAKSAEELADIAIEIRHHHEKWDGTGYPDGLYKESIPLLSRMIAVIDTYDAMTNDRPYRKAVDRRTALNELKRCAGTQFDPSIVNSFVAMIEEQYGEEDYTEEDWDVQDKLFRPRGTMDVFYKSESKEQKSRVSQIDGASFTLDEDGYITKANDYFASLTGYSNEDISRYHLRHTDLLPLEDQETFEEIYNGDRKGILCLEHRLICKDGTTKHVFSSIREFYNSVLQAPRVEVVMMDLMAGSYLTEVARNEGKREERKLNSWMNAARKDALTGALARAAYQNDVSLKLMKNGGEMVMCMIDVDHFKSYNDRFGHMLGDEILKELATVAIETVSGKGLVGRMGGDEFSIFLWKEQGSISDQYLENLFETISKSLRLKFHDVTISMGACRIDRKNTISFDDAYRVTDKALYAAKEAGRNRIVIK